MAFWRPGSRQFSSPMMVWGAMRHCSWSEARPSSNHVGTSGKSGFISAWVISCTRVPVPVPMFITSVWSQER